MTEKPAVRPSGPEQVFTVRLLEAERAVQDAYAHLAALTRRFVEGIVKAPVRSFSFPTENLNRLLFWQTVMKSIALHLHYNPKETRTYQELHAVALKLYGRAAEDFIEENVDLLAEVKFGSEAKP